ncbi:hypothetical protein ABMA28_012054 [Loxostege sticticalis]|uniref:DDE Tnp4 domain-containing protein n=1 Tax=Loxostege sticticalis TaxID=481309 RepID=A0ABD0TLF5_LOXSC
MAHCTSCNASIHEDGNEQYYLICNIGDEIVSVIERQRGYEIDNDGVICERCFVAALHDLQSSYPPSRHDSYVCVWCRSALFQRRTHSLPEGPERNEILLRISPREIPEGSLVCYPCWLRVVRIIQNQENPQSSTQSSDSANVCVWCQASLGQRRSHALNEGPERNLIASRISPREIPNGGRVCYACWVNAQRNVRRHQSRDEQRSMPEQPQQHLEIFCVWCRSSLIRRRTHVIQSEPERSEIAARIYPREVPDNAVVCEDCWTRARQNIHADSAEVDVDHQEPRVRINLDEFSHTTESSSRCFVPGCTRPERLSVPDFLRKRILATKKLYVSERARVCAEHQTLYNWDILDGHRFNNSFTKEMIEAMLQLTISEENDNVLNFENIDAISEPVFKYWTGVTKSQFMAILNEIPILSENSNHPRTALGLYLLKSRTGDSHDRIASLFQISKSSLGRLLAKARDALKTQFVPLHLGTNHISRNDLMSRNLLIPEGLFGDALNRRAIIICDGTYVYLQKSSNYFFQKKSYSLHKYRNLVKPFLLVTTDGHILEVYGPYPATTSDSDIIKGLLQNENGELRRYFQPNDVFILDRGFRDSVPFLESLGYRVHKPESLEEGETQLSTIKANKSRCVTLCRWVVEVVNGRFKRDYKLFRSDFFNLAATHLMDDFRICAALINAFHLEIVDRPDAHLILNRALQYLHTPNYLAEYVIENNINRRRAPFTSIDEEHAELDIFPQMTMSDLVLFALGIYQIKQARSYYGEHKRQHGSFVVEISNQLDTTNIPGPLSSHETVLVRGRSGMNWEEKIKSYYCSCICGKRTVGCCAHVMTMIWYFCWARHQDDNIEGPATFLDGILIRDDIENEI